MNSENEDCVLGMCFANFKGLLQYKSVLDESQYNRELSFKRLKSKLKNIEITI